MTGTDGIEGFATIPRWILHSPELSKDARFVYLLLSSHVGANQRAWPSHARLAEVGRMSVSAVQRALAELRNAGIVEWFARANESGGQTSNEYVLHTSAPRSRRPTPPVTLTDPPVTVTDPPSQADRPPQSEGPAPSVTETDERESLNESQRTRVIEREEPLADPAARGTAGETDDLFGSPKPEPRPRPARKPDPLFDAVLAATIGGTANALTDSARGEVNKAVKELRAVGAEPADVPVRARRYHEVYPNATLTPSALRKHWSSLNGQQQPGSSSGSQLGNRHSYVKGSVNV